PNPAPRPKAIASDIGTPKYWATLETLVDEQCHPTVWVKEEREEFIKQCEVIGLTNQHMFVND
ncbi:MAG: hypothetical protein AAF902_23765, partial [Chloroflexota bacterium]